MLLLGSESSSDHTSSRPLFLLHSSVLSLSFYKSATISFPLLFPHQSEIDSPTFHLYPSRFSTNLTWKTAEKEKEKDGKNRVKWATSISRGGAREHESEHVQNNTWMHLFDVIWFFSCRNIPVPMFETLVSFIWSELFIKTISRWFFVIDFVTLPLFLSSF